MKTTLLISIATATGLAAGQEIQSKPFNLILQSANKSLHGLALSTCHTGAAIESLCLYSKDGSIFHHNTTEGVQPGPGGLPGLLTWELPSRKLHSRFLRIILGISIITHPTSQSPRSHHP